MKYSTTFAMENYYGRDRLQELWQQIATLHFSYLELEESPQKIQQRNKLEDYIHEFLCLAPHNQKFVNRETADVLHRSASTKKDFSGYKAALGFNAIAMYAANLVNQPWRKEYKQIQLYSGFYKHQIDSNLVGAEVIFELMGYKHEGDGILTIDGPICPDRVISASQDSLIAYVECQILKAIWEEVSVNFKISWLEVLEFREAHLCSPKQSIQALNYAIQERQYRQHTRSYSQVPSLPPPYVCPTIPTGQLIEVESPTPHHYDTVDGPSHSRNNKCHTLDSCNSKHEDKSASEKDDVQSDHMGSWDYVYRNLESKGYSKDLGERGDLLGQSVDTRKSKSSVKDVKKPKSNLDDVINNLHINDKPAKSTEPPQKYSKERNRLNSDVSKTNEDDAKKQFTRQSVNGFSKTNTLSAYDKVSATGSSAVNKATNSKTLDVRRSKQVDNDWSKVKEKCQDLIGYSKRWQCTFCTFLNDPSREICEMCSKSKIKVQDTMVIGGPQCPTCTLVNRKDNKACDACQTSLENSPTYI